MEAACRLVSLLEEHVIARVAGPIAAADHRLLKMIDQPEMGKSGARFLIVANPGKRRRMYLCKLQLPDCPTTQVHEL